MSAAPRGRTTSAAARGNAPSLLYRAPGSVRGRYGRPAGVGWGGAIWEPLRAGRASLLGLLRSAFYTGRAPHVYDPCMGRARTNIEIDEGYVRTIMDRYGIHTKTEAVDLALRHLAGQPMTREEALAMRGVKAIDEVLKDVGPAVE